MEVGNADDGFIIFADRKSVLRNGGACNGAGVKAR
jgi:hypothetical protein